MASSLFGYSHDKGSIGDKFRAERFKRFETLLDQIEQPVHILDVGGTEYFWVNRDFHKKEGIKITLLNLEKVETNYEMFDSVVGDATDLSQYEDNEFQLVFSNSVIEHLYNWENQVKMAKECQRVGVFHFIQTPNKFFFIEPHYRVPLFNFIPKKAAYWLLTNTPVAHGHRWSQEMATTWLKEIQLLSHNEFKTLFPNSTIYKEKFLGTNKSFTAHNFLN